MRWSTLLGYAVAVSVLLADGQAAYAQATRTVSGHVFDAYRHPIAGVLVGVVRRASTDHDDLWVVPPRYAPEQPWWVGRFVHTDSAGAFRVELPAAWGAWVDSSLDVIALARNFAPSRTAVSKDVETLGVTLTPSPWQRCVIAARMPDGRPATGAVARVVLGAGDSLLQQQPADSTGRMTFWAPVTPRIRLEATVDVAGYRSMKVAMRLLRDTTAAVTVPLLRPVTGVVRDERGRPLAGVGVMWSASELDGTTAAWKRQMRHAGVLTDTAGNYVLGPAVSIDQPTGSRARMFLDPLADGVVLSDSLFRAMAFTRIHSDTSGRTGAALDIVLRRTREVRIPIVEPRRTPMTGQYVAIWVDGLRADHRPDDGSAIVRVFDLTLADSGAPDGPAVRREEIFHLPPGQYRTVTWRADVHDTSAWFDVPAGTGPLMVAEKRPRIAPIYAMLGKPAPPLEATDLDGKPVSLAAYRGKVVVLDFWGYWCPSCIAAFQRNLIPFADAYRAKPVVVLALHDASVRSRAQFDSAFRNSRQSLFGGRALPFPVVLDRPAPAYQQERAPGEGKTIAAYNVWAFPTTFLIDARGVLVQQIDSGDPGFRAAVDRLMATTGTMPATGR